MTVLAPGDQGNGTFSYAPKGPIVTSVSGTTNRITSSGGATPEIDISPSYVGQSSITTLGTIGTGVWQGTVIGATYGGTGVNNGANTITLGGNISTAASHTLSGAFASTFTFTGSTSVTFPVYGTLASLSAAQTFTDAQTVSLNTNTSFAALRTINANAGSAAAGVHYWDNDTTSTISFMFQNSGAKSNYGGVNSLNINTATTSYPLALGDGSIVRQKFSGGVFYPSIGTTASAASAYLDSSTGQLLRSTSSVAYKTDIEHLDVSYRDSFFVNAKPIWYRSTAAADNPDWSWYGFTAEELAAIDPRLVHWGYADDQYDMIECPSMDGGTHKEPRLKESPVKTPLGVQDRAIIAFLVSKVQELSKKIEIMSAS